MAFVNLKASGFQDRADFHSPGSSPWLWILRTNNREPLVCLCWPKGLLGNGELWPELCPLCQSVQKKMCKRVMLPNSPGPCHHNVPAVFPSPLPHAMYTCDKGTSSSLGWVVNLQLTGAVIWCWAPHVLMAQLLLVMGLKACRSACSLYLCASESPGEVWFELPTLALYCPRVIWFFVSGVRFFWDAHLLDIFFLEVFCLFYICFYLFIFWHRVSLSSPGWPWTCSNAPPSAS